MSKVVHKSPVWVWSPVVLLSTLLLSPVAASALLHVYAAQQQTAANNTPADTGRQNPATASASVPRRVQDEESLRAAARNGQRRLARFDTDPDRPDAAAVAFVLVRVRMVQPVPDDAPLPQRFAPSDAPLSPAPLLSAIPPRAPPIA